ncbi:hypothetical protein DRJ54_03235 [Candidatus Acetothermia bacterium]|nr:MAG: hypothetical protein DRJ54_03235 [Candidatus Acetothermia bacterium]
MAVGESDGGIGVRALLLPGGGGRGGLVPRPVHQAPRRPRPGPTGGGVRGGGRVQPGGDPRGWGVQDVIPGRG